MPQSVTIELRHGLPPVQEVVVENKTHYLEPVKHGYEGYWKMPFTEGIFIKSKIISERA